MGFCGSFLKIHSLVVHYIKTYIPAAVNHNKLYYSCQHMLHNWPQRYEAKT